MITLLSSVTGYVASACGISYMQQRYTGRHLRMPKLIGGLLCNTKIDWLIIIR